ncbi:MAG: hypothetical protein CVV02_17950 [Firmicutes bacterium HGW-Firmicutes-7]|nr:MAG: hypothetical protein CVV02_17950 [Firmicutes bacterium HGW-Firmicutes-7]
MAWCKNCRSEYEPHVKNCAECSEELVDTLEDVKYENVQREDLTDNKCTLLMNVASTFEANAIISLLEVENISAFKGYKSSGEYLNIATGFNYQGTDIFVPIELLYKAKEIVEGQLNSYDMPEEDEGDVNLEELGRQLHNRNRNILRFMLFVLILIPVFVAILTNI